MSNKQQVGIVGAGIVGCATALALQDKGHEVTVFEYRPDPQKHQLKNLKSINLALSNRGIRTLKLIDNELCDKILHQSVPLIGRMIHDNKSHEISQKYGLFGEYNSSIDRGLLNELLIEEVKRRGITILFDHKFVSGEKFDASPKLSFNVKQEASGETEGPKVFEFDFVIGADGSYSQVRYQMQKGMRMNFSQNYIDMQYMELYIPPNESSTSDDKSKYKIDANHLHIWPRENFMLIALANTDGSFTSTFFSSWELIESFKDTKEFIDFFKSNFPDGYKLLGDQHLIDVFENKPRGALVQVSAYPYHSPNGKVLLIGDAAHSMVPFYGQGMNCGLEDVRVLIELIDENHGDLSKAFQSYSPTRKEDLDTICKLAMDNYNEMASKVTKTSYLLRKKLDYYFGKYANGRLFSWIPMYSMISFRDDIPYSKAVKIEQYQNKVVNYLQIGLIGGLALGIFKGLQWYDRFKRN